MIQANQNKTIGEITIRLISKEDAPVITHLSNLLGYPAAEDEIKDRIESLLIDRDHILFAAVHSSGQIISWIQGTIRKLVIVPDHIEVGGLVVDTTNRGKGIGSRLLEAVEIWAINQGISTIYIRSNETRKIAHRFYLDRDYKMIKNSLTFRKELL